MKLVVAERYLPRRTVLFDANTKARLSIQKWHGGVVTATISVTYGPTVQLRYHPQPMFGNKAGWDAYREIRGRSYKGGVRAYMPVLEAVLAGLSFKAARAVADSSAAGVTP